MFMHLILLCFWNPLEDTDDFQTFVVKDFLVTRTSYYVSGLEPRTMWLVMVYGDANWQKTQGLLDHIVVVASKPASCDSILVPEWPQKLPYLAADNMFCFAMKLI